MNDPFLIADTHFGHRGVTQFLNADGSKLRPWSDVDEMDDALVANWNEKVSPKDKVYLLGDAVINRRALPVIGRCNGRKILVKGNHDEFRAAEYLEYFEDIVSTKVLGGFVLTHIPIHPMSLERWSGNIHGHLHTKKVMLGDHVDPRYLCVSVEQIDFAPMLFSDVLFKFRAQKESVERLLTQSI